MLGLTILEVMMSDIKKVMLDTSFLIRLYKKDDNLHQNCREYFEYFLNKKIQMIVSSIATAEYCVKSPIKDIQLDKFRILAFNFQHSEIAGMYHSVSSTVKCDCSRNVIKNDTKMLAQAAYENIDGFVTSDKKLLTVFNKLTESEECKFAIKHIDVNVNPYEFFSGHPVLPFR